MSFVLRENFEDAKTQFLAPLMAVHYAHLVMLAERGIVTREDAVAIRDALNDYRLKGGRLLARLKVAAASCAVVVHRRRSAPREWLVRRARMFRNAPENRTS